MDTMVYNAEHVGRHLQDGVGALVAFGLMTWS